MKNRNRFGLASGAAFAAVLAIPVLTNGCSAANSITNGLCCKDFKAGADMSAVQWDVDVSIKGQFSAFAQASGDFVQLANVTVDNITLACQNMATDLGADPVNQPTLAGKTGPDLMSAWCDIAIAQIKGSFGASGSLKATAKLTVTPAHCHLDASFQASCDAKCNVNIACTPGELSVAARCDPGKITGTCSAECKGSCEGTVQAAVDCNATCEASCQGSCAATATAPSIDCEGTCSANCTGTCEAAAGTNQVNNAHCDGVCKGKCDAKCEVRGGANIKCQGTCTGKCTGDCHASAGATIKCDGSCRGGCSVDYKAPKCEAELTAVPPKCNADANCNASCSASGEARAECDPPRADLQVTANGTLTVDEQAKLDLAIRSLKVNLPKILVISDRGDAIRASLDAMRSSGENIAASGKLKGTAILCGVNMAGAVVDAIGNFGASISVSGKVSASLQ